MKNRRVRQVAAYQVKITLAGSKPEIWRRLLVAPKITLSRLHRIIQTAMGWEDYHLHLFLVDGQQYGAPDPENPAFDIQSEKGITLSSLVERGVKTFTYEYDLGDGWLHEITIEKTVALDADRSPVCIEGARACPPEDSGGLGGYYDKLEILGDRRHEEYRDIWEWMGDFDPERFQLQEVNKKLARLSR